MTFFALVAVKKLLAERLCTCENDAWGPLPAAPRDFIPRKKLSWILYFCTVKVCNSLLCLMRNIHWTGSWLPETFHIVTDAVPRVVIKTYNFSTCKSCSLYGILKRFSGSWSNITRLNCSSTLLKSLLEKIYSPSRKQHWFDVFGRHHV